MSQLSLAILGDLSIRRQLFLDRSPGVREHLPGLFNRRRPRIGFLVSFGGLSIKTEATTEHPRERLHAFAIRFSKSGRPRFISARRLRFVPGAAPLTHGPYSGPGSPVSVIRYGVPCLALMIRDVGRLSEPPSTYAKHNHRGP